MPASGDFDGDGKIDLAIGYGSGVIHVYRNVSASDSIIFDNGISYNTSGGFVHVIKIADFDGDGKIDIASANY